MKTAIREANETDFEQVGQIFTEELTMHSELLPDVFQVVDPIMTSEWYNDILSNPQKTILVAELENEIVGLLQLTIMTNPDDPIYKPRTYAHINEIVVRSTHQGQGIGKLLMYHANLWILDHGIHEVILNVWETNKKAIQFYKGLGYENWRRTMRSFLLHKSNS